MPITAMPRMTSSVTMRLDVSPDEIVAIAAPLFGKA
jgi:hypothetical protein